MAKTEDLAGLLKVEQVIKMLHISRTFLWRITHSKRDRLPSYKLGKSRLYKFEEVMYYLDNHKSK